MATCVVSFTDLEGLGHSVEVDAESLYEAAVLAIRTFRQHGCEPGLVTRLDVQVRTAVTHTVTLQKIEAWLSAGSRTPKEAVTKQRLRSLL